MCAMVRNTSAMPVRPWSTYIYPQTRSVNRYGLRMKNGVCTRFIMNRPVGTTASAESTMAVWYILLSNGYFPALRGAGASPPSARVVRARASRMSSRLIQIDQKSRKNVAWMM